MDIKEKNRTFEINIDDNERKHLIDTLRKQNIDNTIFIQEFIKLLEKMNIVGS